MKTISKAQEELTKVIKALTASAFEAPAEAEALGQHEKTVLEPSDNG